VVFYERAKEILDAPHYYLLGSSGKPGCFDLGFGRSAVHLYAVLVSQLVTVYKEIAVYPLFSFHRYRLHGKLPPAVPHGRSVGGRFQS
jgi:hypothetical protein